ncbi:hypothetical protein RI844_20165 [Thalassotalea fonticola]|uniref:Adhesin n=1 Tax=Thalassotalea fonticola TaxID=3065649 RepID=A0ABZ0GPC5_9GAMM|nr:hypothetical protein RI844_20165 [Colwelliaceae bacterium S1-1]
MKKFIFITLLNSPIALADSFSESHGYKMPPKFECQFDSSISVDNNNSDVTNFKDKRLYTFSIVNGKSDDYELSINYKKQEFHVFLNNTWKKGFPTFGRGYMLTGDNGYSVYLQRTSDGLIKGLLRAKLIKANVEQTMIWSGNCYVTLSDD